MTRALVVIDMQESFRSLPDWSAVADPDIAGRVGRLVSSFRAQAEPVIWVLHAEPGSDGEFDPAKGLVRVFPELAPADDEPTLVKTTINAFTSTELERLLKELEVSEVVVCGMRTEQCCETTARVAGDLGFGVTFVLDATTTSDLEGLKATAIKERTAAVLAGRELATVSDVDSVVAGH